VALVEPMDVIFSDGVEWGCDYGEDVALASTTHLLVVASDEPYLLGKVRRTFSDLSTVQVVRDRRRGERRTTSAEPPERERRVGERRSFEVGVQLRRFGWVLIPLRQSVSA
jgi:hypothetical protein